LIIFAHIEDKQVEGMLRHHANSATGQTGIWERSNAGGSLNVAFSKWLHVYVHQGRGIRLTASIHLLSAAIPYVHRFTRIESTSTTTKAFHLALRVDILFQEPMLPNV